MTSQLSEDLAALDELFSDASRWTKGESARISKRSRRGVSSLDERATCWCLMGNIHRITFSDCVRGNSLYVALLSQVSLGRSLVAYNDARAVRFRDIKALIAKARAAAEQVSP